MKRWSKSLFAIRAALRDLLRGLFSQPTTDAPPDCDYAATLEERYSKPRRCC
jgi:hypothetical protein